MNEVNVGSALSTNAASQVDKVQEKAQQSELQKAEQGKKVEQLTIVEKQQLAEEVQQADEEKQVEAITPQQLEKVAQQLQEFIGEMNRSLEFTVDKDSGRDVIRVLDRNTGDLVKQYPSEEVLTLISKLSDATGNLIDTEI